MVKVANSLFILLLEASAPIGAGSVKPSGGRGTATQALTNMRFRSADQFGSNYDKMGVDALTMIAAVYDNAEQHIKFNHIPLKDTTSPGLRAQYQELVDSAQTVDSLVKQYSDSGRAQEDLKNDNIFEVHIGQDRVVLLQDQDRQRGRGPVRVRPGTQLIGEDCRKSGELHKFV